MTRNRWLLWFAAAIVLVITGAVFAPYHYVESWPWLNTSSIMSKEPAKLTKGRMFDDYFAVEDLGSGTYAIGEPRYYQANYSYLIVGKDRALLFDAGSGTRDMRPVVASLTPLPVTVLPSHLHYDHLGGTKFFDRVAIVDLPQTRARVAEGRFTAGRYEFLGMFDGLTVPSVKVAQWIKPGTMIDLGGRSLEVLSTPGHTPTSIALLDRAAGRLFTGDFIYPTMLYAFLPGADLSAYRGTTQKLLSQLPSDTRLWAAHCCRRDEGYAAPWLTMGDLRDLDRALEQLYNSALVGEGFFPRRYRINKQMDIGTAFLWVIR
jgi:hydroxyacylglutathione hydrolase